MQFLGLFKVPKHLESQGHSVLYATLGPLRDAQDNVGCSNLRGTLKSPWEANDSETLKCLWDA